MAEVNINEMIWQVVASIPEGSITTYGQVAALAGFPNHARYVGTTLKKLPSDTRLPWHRVVNAQGKIAFPENTSAYERQKHLLEGEGIYLRNGRLPLKEHGWRLL